MKLILPNRGHTAIVSALAIFWAIFMLAGSDKVRSALADSSVSAIVVKADDALIDLTPYVVSYDARTFDIAIEIGEISEIAPEIGVTDGSGAQSTGQATAKSTQRQIHLTAPGGPARGEAHRAGYWWIFALAPESAERQARTLVIESRSISGSGLFWPTSYRVDTASLFGLTDDNSIALTTEKPRQFPILLEGEPAQTFALWFNQEPAGLRLQLWTPEELTRYEARRTLLGVGLILLVAGALIYGVAAYRFAPSPLTRSMMLFLAAGFWFVLSHDGLITQFIGLGSYAEAAIHASALGLLVLSALPLAHATHFIDDHEPLLRNGVYGVGGIALLGILAALIMPSLGFFLTRLCAAIALSFLTFTAILEIQSGRSVIRRYLPSIALFDLAALTGILAILGVFGSGLAVDQSVKAVFELGLWACALAIPVLAAGQVVPVAHDNRAQLGLEGAGDGVWDWSAATGELYVGSHIEERLGLQPGELSGPDTMWRNLIHPGDQRVYDNLLTAYADLPGHPLGLVVRLRHTDGSYKWFDINATVHKDNSGYDGNRVIGVARETTDARLTEERLIRDAMHDGLTGLPNRALFLDRLEQAIHRPGPHTHPRAVLLYIDLDRFKSVNDSLGHAAGDRLLVALARRLEKLVGAEDSVARVGGDKFGILSLGTAQDMEPHAFGQFVHEALCAPISISGQEIFPSASIGVAVCEDRHEHAQDILSEAEAAMYEAKDSGKGRVELYTSGTGNNAGDILRLESDMQRALERDEIEFLYQPIITIEDGQVAGFEALMRWNRPGFGLLSPGDFIQLAEETGLIAPLGHYALATASSQLSTWLKTYSQPLFVSVNVSSRQILRHDLIADVAEVLDQARLPRGALKLEVTETMIMENPELAAQVLAQIKALGAGLALDDFGTGYSALAYLNRFPFDTLKIDQSFIRDLVSDKRSAAIVKAILSVAGDLELDVVAEGAENIPTIERLKTMGCDYAQGYHFGAPMTPMEAEQFMDRNLGAPDNR